MSTLLPKAISGAVVTYLYLLSPTGRYSTLAGKLATVLHLKPSTWGNQRGARSHQAISGAVAGDSSLQDRGVAHYLLSLLFSLVSLPFSFYFCVLSQKYQKYLLLLWVPLKTPSCVTSLVTTTMTLFALLLLHLSLQHPLMKLNLLCLTLL